MTEREEFLTARLAEREEEIAQLKETMEAWFIAARKTSDQIAPVMLDCLRLYIKRCKTGGMDDQRADDAEEVLADMIRQYAGTALLPVLRGLAAENPRLR